MDGNLCYSRRKVVLKGGHFKLTRIVTRIDNPGRGMPFRDTDLRQFEMQPAKECAKVE